MKNIDTAIEMSSADEEKLLVSARLGDAAAFEALYNGHKKRVFHLCLRIIKNNAEAEDLTQQVFLQLFRTIASFRGESRVATWLHRVAVNAALMHLRRNRHTATSIDGPDQTSSVAVNQFESASADKSMLGATDRINLFRAIRKLPAGCKRLYLLHDVFGYKHDEIAELAGCSIGCSKSQLHKARKKLQALLEGKPEIATNE